jgi:putative hydrolase of the HAD superfamily
MHDQNRKSTINTHAHAPAATHAIPKDLKGIKAVFFDLGNTLTLFDYAALKELIQDDLFSPPQNRDIANGEYKARELINNLLLTRADTTDEMRTFLYYATILKTVGIKKERIKPLVEIITKYDKTEGIWRVVMRETLSALTQLKDRKLKLGVISNSDGRVDALLNNLNLTGYFDVVLDSKVVGCEKPDPRIFKLALDKTKTAPAEAVYVGDMYAIDILGARRAGMAGVLLDPLHQYTDVDCITIADVAELPSIIK